MYLGKVIGRVIATVKNDALEGKKLLLVRRLPSGPAVVAVDAVGAGAGETVYVCRGREASFAFKPEEVPTGLLMRRLSALSTWWRSNDRPPPGKTGAKGSSSRYCRCEWRGLRSLRSPDDFYGAAGRRLRCFDRYPYARP